MDFQLLSSVALGIALSACCGFRVFVPLLGGAVAGYQQWYELPPDLQWMGTLPAVLAFGTAALVEIAAYYIPVVDNFLDAIASPLAVGAGTLLAASFLPLADVDPLLKWVLALLAGGSAAGTIHAGTGLLRLASTKFTATLGNPVVATGENTAAIGGTVLSFLMPVVIAVVLLLLMGWILGKLLSRRSRR